MFAKEIFSKKRILSALAGAAMLALPVSAFAGHHDHWNHPRPNAWHDHGWHNGWMRHQRARGGWYGPRAERGWYGPPAQRPYGWNNGYGCDEDGDRCGWGAGAPMPSYQPNYGYRPGVWRGDDDGDEGAAGAYPSYLQQSPAGLPPSQSLSWLMAKRQRTMATIAQLRARHDSRGAARLVPSVTALNRRIATLNNRSGYNGNYGYGPTSYVAPVTSSFNPLPYNSPIPYNTANPYYGGGYYNTPYTGNPTVDALSALAIPMLSGIH
jgi:hypothetical protein